MIVLLRSIGIPAREVVGLAGGTADAQRGGYLYRESGAHAWPEAYFPGNGWIGFEPTAGYIPPPAVVVGAVAVGGDPSPLRIVAPTAAIVAGLIAAGWLRARRGRASVARYYQRLVRAGTLLGVRPSPATTPDQRACLLAARLPEARRAIEALTALYVGEQYGDQRPATRDLQRAWRDVRRAVIRRLLHVRGAVTR